MVDANVGGAVATMSKNEEIIIFFVKRVCQYSFVEYQRKITGHIPCA